MSKDYRKYFAEQNKGKKFAAEYSEAHEGVLPSIEAINEAKVLSEEENALIDLNARVGAIIAREGKETGATWDYVHDEASWNESYENGVLKAYYEWADTATSPYREDLYNTVANRPANGSDWHKENGEYVFDENGNYIYDNCVRCWEGAVKAPGAKYPWCAVAVPASFKGSIRFNYDGGADVWPWGSKSRNFKRGFGVASIPVELGEEFLLVNGETSFDPSKLVVSLVADPKWLAEQSKA